MRRELITWSVVLGVILAGFGATVLVLNSTLYSAVGLRAHLPRRARAPRPDGGDRALRHDRGDGRREPGAAHARRDGRAQRHPGGVATTRMPAASTSSPSSTRRTACWAPPSSRCAATAPCSACSTTGPSCRVRSRRCRSRCSTSASSPPTASNSSATQDVAEPYLVLTPTTIELSHDSEFYHADPEKVLVDEPGGTVDAAVDLKATPAFVAEVQRQVEDFLTACTTQRVLLPAGCPFGETIVNRIVTEPVWSMTTFPAVTLDSRRPRRDLAGAADGRDRPSRGRCAVAVRRLDLDLRPGRAVRGAVRGDRAAERRSPGHPCGVEPLRWASIALYSSSSASLSRSALRS